MIRGSVAIVGRPNVGKSTIFNRLTKSNRAIIDDRPGVTRDRIYGSVLKNDPQDHWESFLLVDTGGFETKGQYYQPFSKNLVWDQTQIAIEEADVVVMVFDGKAGLHPHDQMLVRYLQKLNKPVIYLVNKIDGREQQTSTFEFHELGLDELYSCSAAHNKKIWELSEVIESTLEQCPQLDRKRPKTSETRISLIGRPNVGKSSILNRLLGENRSLVSDISGTTRDSVDAEISYNGHSYTVVDTAGVRRKTKINEKLESLSVLKSMRSIDASDVVILVTTHEGINEQDAKLANLAIQQFKPLLIVVNKWDLHEDKSSNTIQEMTLDIRAKLKSMAYVPVLFTSCLENKRVHKILSEVEKLAEAYRRRSSTSDVNSCLETAVRHHTPALIRRYNKRVKFFYATQVKASPPTIVVKCNVAGEIQESYKKYLTNQFRKNLGFDCVPLRVLYRGKEKKNSDTDDHAL